MTKYLEFILKVEKGIRIDLENQTYTRIASSDNCEECTVTEHRYSRPYQNPSQNIEIVRRPTKSVPIQLRYRSDLCIYRSP